MQVEFCFPTQITFPLLQPGGEVRGPQLVRNRDTLRGIGICVNYVHIPPGAVAADGAMTAPPEDLSDPARRQQPLPSLHVQPLAGAGVLSHCHRAQRATIMSRKIYIRKQNESGRQRRCGGRNRRMFSRAKMSRLGNRGCVKSPLMATFWRARWG